MQLAVGQKHARHRVQSDAGTGAPAQSTRRSVGSVMLCARQWSKIFRQSVGEPKELVTFSCRMAWTIFAGIDRGRTRRIDLGHDGGHAERGIEEREDRQHRQVDFAGLDVVGVADEPHLRVEHAVFVADALGRAGGAGGEEDRGEVGGAAATGGGPTLRPSAACGRRALQMRQSGRWRSR